MSKRPARDEVERPKADTVEDLPARELNSAAADQVKGQSASGITALLNLKSQSNSNVGSSSSD